MLKLPDDLEARFNARCDRGDALMSEENYSEALHEFRSAHDLLPEPRDRWEPTVWVLGAIAHCCFALKDFTSCRDAVQKALQLPSDPDNPLAYMRLGQCEFELRNLEAAAAALDKAYQLGGAEIFAVEDFKYFAFLQKSRPAPAGGWS